MLLLKTKTWIIIFVTSFIKYTNLWNLTWKDNGHFQVSVWKTGQSLSQKGITSLVGGFSHPFSVHLWGSHVGPGWKHWGPGGVCWHGALAGARSWACPGSHPDLCHHAAASEGSDASGWAGLVHSMLFCSGPVMH